jgi:23S rRNA pseudouridine1911/1915/1917 synthase
LKTIIRESVPLFQFLISSYPDSPRTRIKKLLRTGAVRINDKRVTSYSFILKPGDLVEISRNKGEASRAGIPFPIIYEDQHLLALDKPPGIATSGTGGITDIQQIVSEALKGSSKGKLRSYVVHRLDKEVSGILLLARTALARDILKENWKETEKHYYALVEGIPADREGTIKSWLIEDEFQKVHSTIEKEGAKFAVTHYRILKILKGYTLLDVKTDTGRKNQIRVHLSDIGCPIAGDFKYGASAQYKRRVRLHACKLSFPHPIEKKIVTLESPMPAGFLKLNPANEKYKS